VFDLRNQTSSIIQPEMVAARDLADVRQLTAQQVTLSPGGGGQISNVGSLLSTQPTGSAQAPVLTDAQRFQNIGSAVSWNTVGYQDSEGGYVYTGTAINSVTASLSVPSIGQYLGAWTFMRVRIDYRVTGATTLTGARDVVITDRNATSATVALGLNTDAGNVNFSYTVTVSFGYAAAPEAVVASAQFGGPLAWTTSTQVSDGEVGYTSVVTQSFTTAGAFDGAFKTYDLGPFAASSSAASFQVRQDQVQGDLLSTNVSWTPAASDPEGGYDQILLSGVTVNLPVASFSQTFGSFVRAVVYVDYDLTGDAYGTRTVQVTTTDPSATSVYVPINYTTAAGNVTFSHNVRVAYYWTSGNKEIQLASPGTQSATIAWTQQVSDGEGGYYTVQNFAAATAFNRSFYADTSNKTFFSGGSELLSANEAYLLLPHLGERGLLETGLVACRHALVRPVAEPGQSRRRHLLRAEFGAAGGHRRLQADRADQWRLDGQLLGDVDRGDGGPEQRRPLAGRQDLLRHHAGDPAVRPAEHAAAGGRVPGVPARATPGSGSMSAPSRPAGSPGTGRPPDSPAPTTCACCASTPAATSPRACSPR
jgi:hypothetical protein